MPDYFSLPLEIIEKIESILYNIYLEEHKKKMYLVNMIIVTIGLISDTNREELLEEGYNNEEIGEEYSCTNILLYVSSGWENRLLKHTKNFHETYIINSL